MFCNRCGKELTEESKFCSYCGNKVPTEIVKEEVKVETHNEISNGKSLGFGIASLACGVYGLCFLSIPFIGLPFSIVALCLSSKGLNTRWHKFSKAGHITGKLGVIFNAILLGLFSFIFLFI